MRRKTEQKHRLDCSCLWQQGMDRRIKYGAAALAWLLAAGDVAAATLTVTPSQDATLYEDPSGQLANGAGFGIFAGKVDATTGGRLRRGLVKFDLSAVPAGSTVTSVSLTINASKGNPPTATTLHRVTTSWGEGASHAGGNEGGGTTPLPNDATWTSRFFGTAQSWTNPGGDFVASASASAGVGLALGSVTWASPTMLGDVQGWVAAPASNNGWLLRGDEVTTGSTVKYDSRESTTPGLRPALTVIYTAPAAQVDDWSGY
jgi:hypothetical protein